MPKIRSLDRLILDLLTHGPMFGLDLINSSGGLLARGTVYVKLSRLKGQGLVASRLEDEPVDPENPRTLWELTELGRDAY